MIIKIVNNASGFYGIATIAAESLPIVVDSAKRQGLSVVVIG